MTTVDTDPARPSPWPPALLGFALGGFFDGILLHQILQWHHLLSGVPGAAFRDIRVQILADGLFHLLMYLVAVAGLWMLWRRRGGSSGRELVGAALVGFGAWHVADAVLSHWLLGIHRIRMDTHAPLAWDVGWLAVFGLLPILVGLGLRRARTGGPGGRAAAAILTAVVATSGAVAGLPPAKTSAVMAYFPPGTTPETVMAAAAAVDARVLWSDGSGQLWAFALPQNTSALTLYRHGAVYVGGTLVPAGCLSWTRPA